MRSFFSVKHEPLLTLAYAGSTNLNGLHIQRFKLTNRGNAAAVHAGSGYFELNSPSSNAPGAYDPSRMIDGGYSHDKRCILPGETQTIEVTLPSLPSGERRYVCSLAHDTIRTRIYDWQWGPNGQGAKANWLIPQFLQGKMFDVKVETEWLKPDSPLN